MHGYTVYHYAYYLQYKCHYNMITTLSYILEVLICTLLTQGYLFFRTDSSTVVSILWTG